MIKSETYYSLSMLKHLGWTKASIRKFLGDEDVIKPNTRGHGHTPIKLFLISRIKEIEKRDDYKLWMKDSKILKDRAKKNVENKRNEIIKEINNIEIELPYFYDLEDLKQSACIHYNEIWEINKFYDKYASVDDDERFINEITVNFLRHACSNFKKITYSFYGRIGKDKVDELIFEKILHEISEVYPHLKNECKKQIRLKNILMRKDIKKQKQ